MLADLAMPPMARCGALVQRLDNVAFWLNAGGVRSHLHFDGGDFFLSQLSAEKRLYLVDPLHSLALYNDFAAAYGQSPIRTEQVDLLSYPAVANVTLHVAHLFPGDMLFIPTRWWHMVHSLPAGGDEALNLAVTLQTELPRTDAFYRVPTRTSHFSYHLFDAVHALRAPGLRAGPQGMPLSAIPQSLHACVNLSFAGRYESFPEAEAAKLGWPDVADHPAFEWRLDQMPELVAKSRREAERNRQAAQ